MQRDVHDHRDVRRGRFYRPERVRLRRAVRLLMDDISRRVIEGTWWESAERARAEHDAQPPAPRWWDHIDGPDQGDVE